MGIATGRRGVGITGIVASTSVKPFRHGQPCLHPRPWIDPLTTLAPFSPPWIIPVSQEMLLKVHVDNGWLSIMSGRGRLHGRAMLRDDLGPIRPPRVVYQMADRFGHLSITTTFLLHVTMPRVTVVTMPGRCLFRSTPLPAILSSVLTLMPISVMYILILEGFGRDFERRDLVR